MHTNCSSLQDIFYQNKTRNRMFTFLFDETVILNHKTGSCFSLDKCQFYTHAERYQEVIREGIRY